MEGCSPAGLTELMRTFPDARFDLSHAGYPYLREGAVLGKTFPNCFLNMSWIHIISPQGARHDLKEWLRMVPSNKIIAFGDDVMHVEVVYGHLKMARQNFAIVLAELIEEGLLSQAASLEVAQAAFHDTPAAVYGVQP
jgi:predicted TIM-barrel fold metal-dependent hydrolase